MEHKDGRLADRKERINDKMREGAAVLVDTEVVSMWSIPCITLSQRPIRFFISCH